MALMEVVHYGDPILRKKCKPVTDFEKLPGLIEDMFDTMYEENGIGLAANQVGIDLHLFIIDISDFEKEGESIHVFINGEILDTSGESWFEEGCLSIPDVRLDVKRPETITFKYQDESGDEHTKWGTVGVSENIIEASWQALIDSIAFKLNCFSKSSDKTIK